MPVTTGLCHQTCPWWVQREGGPGRPCEDGGGDWGGSVAITRSLRSRGRREDPPQPPGASGGHRRALPTPPGGHLHKPPPEAPSWRHCVTMAVGNEASPGPRCSPPRCGAAGLPGTTAHPSGPGSRPRGQKGVWAPHAAQVPPGNMCPRQGFAGRATGWHEVGAGRRCAHGCPPAQSSQAEGTRNAPQATRPPASHTRSPSSSAQQSQH